ncbi:MAG: sugar phosphate nucleotidyltransferase [Planctomycetota bacterium]|nr:sugar phosphate nucleotidyltransferase [Planctomycetota bacterium]
MTDKAVILARGLGTRMRKDSDSAHLSKSQSSAADAGVKAMIPTGRPFLDYVLTALADAGYRRACLVIGPEHDSIRDYYGQKGACRRLGVEFAVQVEPRGTADAVAAAETFAAGDHFLMINSDNYYPPEALSALRELPGSGLAVFDRETLLAGSNIPPERINKFAVIQFDAERNLLRILEKPQPEQISALTGPICISMNCWRFGPEIFQACRSISPSPRGEMEITDAVQYAIDSLGVKFRSMSFQVPVLDLSSRDDIAEVAKRLADVKVSF